jgi:hypothetical protein
MLNYAKTKGPKMPTTDNAAYIRKKHDSWLNHHPFVPPEIEICVVDIGQVQQAFLMVDEEAVIQAWRGGKREFEGLDVYELPN